MQQTQSDGEAFDKSGFLLGSRDVKANRVWLALQAADNQTRKSCYSKDRNISLLSTLKTKGPNKGSHSDYARNSWIQCFNRAVMIVLMPCIEINRLLATSKMKTNLWYLPAVLSKGQVCHGNPPQIRQDNHTDANMI